MNRTLPVVVAVVILAASGLPAPTLAQSRVEQQLMVELQTLQEQTQRLQASINALTEQLRQTNSRVEAQGQDAVKGFADQRVFIEALGAEVRALTERQNDGSVRVAQLSQEVKAIREGLSLQQTLLNEILTLLHPLASGAAAAGGDPAAAGPPGTPPTTRSGAALPPSPTAYYNAAFGYFFNNQFDFAVEALKEAISRFPDAPDAARAQYTIGEAYFQMGGHNKEALEAYTLVIKNYKDPEVLPDAYHKQGLVYEAMGQKDEACRAQENVRTLFKESSSAIFATQALKRLGCIK